MSNYIHGESRPGHPCAMRNSTANTVTVSLLAVVAAIVSVYFIFLGVKSYTRHGSPSGPAEEIPKLTGSLVTSEDIDEICAYTAASDPTKFVHPLDNIKCKKPTADGKIVNDEGICKLIMPAKLANVHAQTFLAMCFELGVGTTVDLARAEILYEYSQMLREPMAMKRLKNYKSHAKPGERLQKVYTVEDFGDLLDFDKESIKYLKSFKPGNTIANFFLSAYYQKKGGKEKKANHLLMEAVTEGLSAAQFAVYQKAKKSGVDSVSPMDPKTCLANAASQGMREAQYYMAVDTVPDIPLLVKSAKQGYRPAVMKLAEFLSKGEGVEKDVQTAKRLYQFVADRYGDSRARDALNALP